MKKFLILLFSVILVFSSCKMENTNKFSISSEKLEIKNEIINEATINKSEETKAIWLSYIDLYYADKTEEEFKNDINEKFDKIKALGLNRVICHIRANSDAAYFSEIFPFSEKYSGTEGLRTTYDPLDYMVKAAKERDLYIEGWINPYRVSTKTTDINELSDQNPAKIWLTDNDKSNDNNVLFTENGIFYNPASEGVRKLIVDGITEVLENYDIDGIQFDDYFYPTTEKDFDKISYDTYKSSAPSYLPLDEWRRTNVNILISQVYKTVHKFEGKTFGISPAAAISEDKSDTNYKNYYADIYTWMSDEGYIDYIAPQLYFGYEYPLNEYKFSNILKTWKNADKHRNLKLYIGLASYKIGLADAESKEWINGKDIIANQIKDIRSLKIDGFMLYSYSAVFSENKRNSEERNAIKKILEQKNEEKSKN